MKAGKMLRTVLLALFMALIVSSVASAALVYTPTPQKKQTGVFTKTVDGKTFLYDATSRKRVTGKAGAVEYPAGSGCWYYFRNSKGQIARSEWVKADSTYYARYNGMLYAGWSNTKNHTYFSRKNCKMLTGWIKIGTKVYRLSDGGVLQLGWKRIGDYSYYLDPAQGGARATGWKKMSAGTFFFTATGKNARGGIHRVDGARYYFDKNGVRKTGMIVVNNRKYFFNTKTAKMHTGWLTYGGKRYYMRTSGTYIGSAATGWLSLGTQKNYYFNSEGVLQKGWMTVGLKKYYLNPTTGAQTYGTKVIDGKTYDFGTKGYIEIEPTGAWSIKVNLSTNVVTVYRGNYPVKAMRCSTGAGGATPSGTFYLRDKLRWHTLNGPCYGQYCSHITSGILFHSVWYYQPNPYTLADDQYRLLGQSVSHGCIRLACGDAYYLYVNCPVGTTVTNFWGTSANDPLGKPGIVPQVRPGVDPTDPVYK